MVARFKGYVGSSEVPFLSANIRAARSVVAVGFGSLGPHQRRARTTCMADFGKDLLGGDMWAMQLLFFICLPIFLVGAAIVWLLNKRPSKTHASASQDLDAQQSADSGMTTTQKVVIFATVLLFLVFLALIVPRVSTAGRERNDARQEVGILLLGAAGALVLLTTVWLLAAPRDRPERRAEVRTKSGPIGATMTPGGRAGRPTATPLDTSVGGSAVRRLAELQELLDNDLISQEQFDAKQQDVLDSI